MLVVLSLVLRGYFCFRFFSMHVVCSVTFTLEYISDIRIADSEFYIEVYWFVRGRAI